MKLSISTGDMTYGYRTVDVPFLRLPEITSRYNYSVGLYSNGHRHRDNLVGMSELLMYDFDDGYPIDECIAFFESVSITAFFATSRNHQKVKSETKPACDRYRLFIPFNQSIALPFGEYQSFYMYIATLLGLDELNDHSTQDPVRFFFPNPEQQTHLVNTGQVLDFPLLRDNWEAYTSQQKEKEQTELKKQKKNWKPRNSSAGGLKENELPRSFLIETKKGAFSFEYFDYLRGNDTAPCRCPNPAHPDRNPSAFVGRSKSSGGLFVKCSSCGYVRFMGAE